MSRIRVHWSERESVIEVSDADELEHVLDDIASSASAEYPTIVFIDSHGYRVSLGLGREKSFVHFEQESGDPPYIITVGDSGAGGTVAFYLLGNHHTEIPRRNLISTEKAREVLHEWVQRAVRSTDMKWEEV
jgi:hypothetical protein